jgi:hypothetical protein
MKLRLVTMLTLALFAPACGKPPARGSGAKSTTTAKDSGQKTSSTVTNASAKGSSSGATKDGVTCDGSLEGVGYCAADTTVVFCAGGQWWALECSALDETAFCGVDEAGLLDCWVE